MRNKRIPIKVSPELHAFIKKQADGNIRKIVDEVAFVFKYTKEIPKLVRTE